MPYTKINRNKNNIPLEALPSIKSGKQIKNKEDPFESLMGEDVRDFNPFSNRVRNFKALNDSPENSTSITSSEFDDTFDLHTKLEFSSSSSLSWSEEYELEIAKKVQYELEKLDSAFLDPEHTSCLFDVEEIREWKSFFPSVFILGRKTPTNSSENSICSSESEEESTLLTEHQANKKGVDLIPPRKNFHTLPHKPRSLEIEKYLKISSFKSPLASKRKLNGNCMLQRQSSTEITGNVSPEYSSLPFITATSVKTQCRRPKLKNESKVVTLPPITNHVRSISATPRQASSKSMFTRLNFEKDASAKGAQIRLQRDLMKLFDHIPISNR